MVFRASFDDSGTHGNSDVAVWGGVIGDIEQYHELERHWEEFLKRPVNDDFPSITTWHSTECIHGKGEFDGWPMAARDRARRNARQAIIKSGVVSVSFAVPCNLYTNIVAPVAPPALKTPGSAAFAKCGEHLSWLSRRRNQPVICVYDAGQQCADFDIIVSWWEEWGKDIGANIAHGFRQVAGHAGLQAADCVATETYWVAKRVVKGELVELDAQQQAFFGKVDPVSLIMNEAEMKLMADGWKDIEWG